MNGYKTKWRNNNSGEKNIIIRLTKTSRKISECHERQIWKFFEWGEHHRTWPAFANHPKLWPKAQRQKRCECDNSNTTTSRSSSSSIIMLRERERMTTRKAKHTKRKTKGNERNTFEWEIHCLCVVLYDLLCVVLDVKLHGKIIQFCVFAIAFYLWQRVRIFAIAINYVYYVRWRL